jgi:hypothetical protein
MTQPLDLGPLMIWIGAISVLLSFGTTIWNIFSSPAKKAEARVAEVVKRTEMIELRIQRLEDELRRMPTLDMMHRLELTLARMEGHIDKMDERLKPVTSIAERMQEWMLENGK